MNKYNNTLRNTMLAVCTTLSISSCAQQSSVTKAPHRTQASQEQLATVVSSYPIRVTKNSGVGAVAGGIGGSVLGSKVGSGSGSFAGAVGGQLLGLLGGRKAESAIRETDAQEVTIKIENRKYTLVSKNNRTFKSGEKVMASTNVYGTPLSIKPIK